MSVYVIVAGDVGFAKIGYTRAPKARLERLQTGCPHELKIAALIPAGPDDEKRLHRRFNRLHLRGEWFRMDQSIQQLIDAFPFYASVWQKYDFRAGRKRTHRELPTGVTRHRRKYRAEIKFNGVRCNLGSFDTVEAARAAYLDSLMSIDAYKSKRRSARIHQAGEQQ